MKKLFFSFFIFISTLNHAQERIQVLDSISLLPLSDVNITFKNKGTSTDENGFFSIKNFFLLTDKDSLTFSSIGYKTIKLNMADLKKRSIIHIPPKSEVLRDVIITSNTLLKELNYESLKSMPDGLLALLQQ